MHAGGLPFLKCLEQFVSPQQYAKKVLDDYTHKFAWGKYGECHTGLFARTW